MDEDGTVSFLLDDRLDPILIKLKKRKIRVNFLMGLLTGIVIMGINFALILV